MRVLKIQFIDRTKPIFLPLDEGSVSHLLTFLDAKKRSPGAIQLTSALGNDVWLNLSRVESFNLLLEANDLPFTETSILDSLYLGSEDVEPDLEETRWSARVLVANQLRAHAIDDISGHDWTTIESSFEQDRPFFVIVDGDGEEVGFNTARIELIIGTEEGRYSGSQREALNAYLDRMLDADQTT
ncbi:MAG: hypothetical protein KIT44_06325 [Opitutaceae bacterium]|nr:hypothetical protein [Opitutaceae bacterium]